jgi:RHS repeat-associated protein
LEWNAYGKVRQVTTSTATMTFGYDAQQNRLKKTVATNSGTKTTYYIRDAQGNALAVYEQNGASLVWKEQDLYGSSRLGMAKPEREVTGFFWASAAYTLVAGAKSYELSNHLGNVMAVISDRGELQSAQDFYPFGMAMPGRSTGAYKYTFNGKETDPETGIQDYGMRWYLPNIARFPSIDPLEKKFPWWTPYAFAGNTPIQAIDLEGAEIYYSQSGRKVGQGADKDNQQVLMAEGGKTTNGIYNPTGKVQKLHNNHSEFLKLLGTVYTETSSKNKIQGGQFDPKESAGIYDVMENISKTTGQAIDTKMFKNEGIYGWQNAEGNTPQTTQDVIDGKIGFGDEKYGAVWKGLTMGILTSNSVLDYSGGGDTWHGYDFGVEGKRAYNLYYATGFKFSDPKHDIWKLGDKMVNVTVAFTGYKSATSITTHFVHYDHRAVSTGAAGGTTFMKRNYNSFVSDDIPAFRRFVFTNPNASQDILRSKLLEYVKNIR